MYYAHINNDGQIIDFSETQYLNFINIEVTQEQYELAREKGLNYFIYQDGEIVINPNYDQEQADKREAEFESSFFLIPDYGWYRKQPKGYSSAVESLNTAFNAVSIMGQLPAGMLIFYQAPDFTKPEECTEEWLIEHQIYSETMTAQEFGAFYVKFITVWNNQEHVHEVENADTANEQSEL